jgi:hypothetical protein
LGGVRARAPLFFYQELGIGNLELRIKKKTPKDAAQHAFSILNSQFPIPNSFSPCLSR